MANQYEQLCSQLDSSKLPKHVAIIMDGNGRWAKKRLQNRLFGHSKGAVAVRHAVEAAAENDIEYLTLYAFSTENWRRAEEEVSGLFKLIMDTIIHEIDELASNNIIVRFIGRRAGVDPNYMKRIDEVCSRSWNNTGMHLNVAFNYGGRQEIVDAVNKLIQTTPSDELQGRIITEEDIQAHLYTAGMPDPDLVIRTSGELRLSNYLIWQAAYAEFWVTETLWPDFSKEEFVQAVIQYQQRSRRFGGA